MSAMRTVLSRAALLLALAAGIGSAATHYVAPAGNDRGRGTEKLPFRSLRRALQSARPGDVVLVADGWYNEPVAPARGGTANAPLTIRAQGKEAWFGGVVDVNDSRLTPVPDAPGCYSILQSVPRGTQLWQRFYDDILVDDPNHSRFHLKASNGPAPMVQVGKLAELKTVEGSWMQAGTTLYLHLFPHQGEPADTTTDVRIVRQNGVDLQRGADYVVLEGLRFGSGGHIESSHAVLRDCSSYGQLGLGGSYNLVEGHLGCHALFRKADGGYSWFTRGEGYAMHFQFANHCTVRNSRFCYSWNVGPNFNGDGGACENNLVESTWVHGAPNHSLSGTEAHNNTVRNCVVFNCQDGPYFIACRNLTVENCTMFGGFFLREYPAWTPSGPYFVRNNIICGSLYFTNSEKAFLPGSKWEEGSIFENNLFLIGGDTPKKMCFHTQPDGKMGPRLTLDKYMADAQAANGAGYATMRNNIIVTSGFEDHLVGGRWKGETDEWNVHITSEKSAAYNAGVDVSFDKDYEGDPRKVGGAVDIGADESAGTKSEVPNATL